jgi:hypothetical protein
LILEPRTPPGARRSGMTRGDLSAPGLLQQAPLRGNSWLRPASPSFVAPGAGRWDPYRHCLHGADRRGQRPGRLHSGRESVQSAGLSDRSRLPGELHHHHRQYGHGGRCEFVDGHCDYVPGRDRRAATPGLHHDGADVQSACDLGRPVQRRGRGWRKQCNLTCSVAVANNVVAGSARPGVTVNQCVGSGTGGGTQPTLLCAPVASTTGATVTQCNGSATVAAPRSGQVQRARWSHGAPGHHQPVQRLVERRWQHGESLRPHRRHLRRPVHPGHRSSRRFPVRPVRRSLQSPRWSAGRCLPLW